MDSRIEVQLNRTVVMLGPEVTIALSTDANDLPPLTFRSLHNKLEQNTKPIDISPLQQQGRSPAPAARKGNVSSHTITEKLMELQRKGALLAYLYPDTVIDEALGLESFDNSKMDKWMQHERSLMHVFGHNNNADSMLCFKKNQPLVSDEFLNATNDKIYVCVGFNESSDLDSFLRQLPREEPRHILLPCESVICASRGLFVPCANCYESLCPMGDPSMAIGAMIENQSCDLAQSVSFILANKTDYVKVAKLVSSLPNAGFQLMTNMEYGRLSFHVLTVEIAVNNDGGLQVFWQALVNQPAVMESLVKCSVLAVVLDKCTIVWLGGGKLTKSSPRSLTLGELMSKGSNAVTLTNTQSSSVISSVPKQNKIHPRYTAVKKRSLDSKDGAMVPPSSVFRRRMSLPPHTLAAVPLPAHNFGRGSTGLNVSSRQQFLLNKHFLNQKNNDQGIAPVKPEHKRLRQLLQDKPKEYHKPSPSSIKHMTEWISGKRKALFARDTKEWSTQVNRDLEKKLAKWRRFREKQLEKKREEEEAQQHERLRRSSLESNASSTSSDIIRQHLSATATTLPIPSPLLTAVNPHPYILPQTANFALRTASMMYHPSYFSSYPLLTTVPMPYLLPNASNLVLVSNNSMNPSTATITTTNSVKRPSPPIIPLTVPILPQSIPSVSSGSPPVPTVTRSKRKHSSAGKSYSEISSLLMKKDTDPPAVKQSRMVSSPASLSDEKSEDEEHMSCESSETEDNQLPLWKFLLELLLSNAYSHLIGWTRIHSLEFQLKQPKEVAKLWSSYKSDRSIDYGRFRKGLQFYCTKEQPILNSVVSGEEHIYCFSSSMLYYINNRYSQLQRTELSVLNSSNLQSSREMCGSQEVLVVD